MQRDIKEAGAKAERSGEAERSNPSYVPPLCYQPSALIVPFHFALLLSSGFAKVLLGPSSYCFFNPTKKRGKIGEEEFNST